MRITWAFLKIRPSFFCVIFLPLILVILACLSNHPKVTAWRGTILMAAPTVMFSAVTYITLLLLSRDHARITALEAELLAKARVQARVELRTAKIKADATLAEALVIADAEIVRAQKIAAELLSEAAAFAVVVTRARS